MSEKKQVFGQPKDALEACSVMRPLLHADVSTKGVHGLTVTGPDDGVAIINRGSEPEGNEERWWALELARRWNAHHDLLDVLRALVAQIQAAGGKWRFHDRLVMATRLIWAVDAGAKRAVRASHGEDVTREAALADPIALGAKMEEDTAASDTPRAEEPAVLNLAPEVAKAIQDPSSAGGHLLQDVAAVARLNMAKVEEQGEAIERLAAELAEEKRKNEALKADLERIAVLNGELERTVNVGRADYLKRVEEGNATAAELQETKKELAKAEQQKTAQSSRIGTLAADLDAVNLERDELRVKVATMEQQLRQRNADLLNAEAILEQVTARAIDSLQEVIPEEQQRFEVAAAIRQAVKAELDPDHVRLLVRLRREIDAGEEKLEQQRKRVVELERWHTAGMKTAEADGRKAGREDMLRRLEGAARALWSDGSYRQAAALRKVIARLRLQPGVNLPGKPINWRCPKCHKPIRRPAIPVEVVDVDGEWAHAECAALQKSVMVADAQGVVILKAGERLPELEPGDTVQLRCASGTVHPTPATLEKRAAEMLMETPRRIGLNPSGELKASFYAVGEPPIDGDSAIGRAVEILLELTHGGTGPAPGVLLRVVDRLRKEAQPAGAKFLHVGSLVAALGIEGFVQATGVPVDVKTVLQYVRARTTDILAVERELGDYSRTSPRWEGRPRPTLAGAVSAMIRDLNAKLGLERIAAEATSREVRRRKEAMDADDALASFSCPHAEAPCGCHATEERLQKLRDELWAKVTAGDFGNAPGGMVQISLTLADYMNRHPGELDNMSPAGKVAYLAARAEESAHLKRKLVQAELNLADLLSEFPRELGRKVKDGTGAELGMESARKSIRNLAEALTDATHAKAEAQQRLVLEQQVSRDLLFALDELERAAREFSKQHQSVSGDLGGRLHDARDLLVNAGRRSRVQ